MPKIEIDVDQILTCAMPIEAEAGDKLFVMNGMVIGLVERSAVKPKLVHSRPHTPAARADSHAPKRQPSQNEGQGVYFTEAIAIEELRRHGPATVREIGDRLNLTREQRARLGYVLRKAVDAGEATHDGASYPRYRVVTEQMREVEAAG